ncbi:MAG TPA: hypothetical protein VFH83_00875, partial [Spirochaetia bacterium]|nr:hypothetical protein [Spirochaetia bacterium]
FYDHPEAVRTAIDFISETFLEMQEDLWRLIQPTNQRGGVLPWMMLWMPGKHGNQLACDLSSVLSPSIFRSFFIPSIRREGQWTAFGTYHLDGPACIRAHLDALLETDEIKAIEWTPGAGSPPASHPEYFPQYRRIQASGKRLILLAEIREVETILSELSARGLYIITRADTEEEAKDLLRKVGSWTRS